MRTMHLCRTIMVALIPMLTTACATIPSGPANPPMRVDAGPLRSYALDGTYDSFAGSHGFMLVTFGGRLAAVSATCPHDRSTLRKAGDGLVCPKDGSTFESSGNRRDGPAKEPLLRYVMSLDSRGHVIVDTTRPLIQGLWGRTDAYLVVPR